MIDIVVLDKDPLTILDIVRDLKTQGLSQGKDFDFAYKPASWHDFSGDIVYNRHTIFSFYTEELASWFALKYVNEIS